MSMTTTLMPAAVKPLPYARAYEVLEEGEAETRDKLLETLHRISETTFKDSGHALRSVHAKTHGLLTGQLQVLPHLPDELAQGIFQTPGTWPVVMRLSTIPGDILDDDISTPRGLAVKVIGVDGDRLEGSEDDVTQDFVLVTGPAFGAPNAKKFLSQLKLLAATTDRAPGLKSALAAVFRGTERAIEAVGGQSSTLRTLGGYPETPILGETFYSQAPILFGPYMAKIAVMPASPSLRALTEVRMDFSGKPNALRDAVVEYFAKNAAEWEVRVQLCTDLQKMPIENASVAWPEELCPYLTVARIVAPPQVAWSTARALAIDDTMSFSPWHGVAAHRPIGSMMRVRQLSYRMSAKFRTDHNGGAAREPRSLESLAL
jgi:hypothetical protein